MGSAVFKQNNLETRLNETITDAKLPDSIPEAPSEPPTLKEYYIERGKEIRRDLYDSDLGKICKDLSDKVGLRERLNSININYNSLCSWLKDCFSGIDIQQIATNYYEPILSVGAFTGGTLLCYMSNKKR